MSCANNDRNQVFVGVEIIYKILGFSELIPHSSSAGWVSVCFRAVGTFPEAMA